MAVIPILEDQTAGEVAEALLAIADANPDVFSPADVQTQTDNGLEFRVPDGMEELYLEYLKTGEVAKADLNEEAPAEENDEAAAPKRRGRPPKIQTEG